MTDPDPGEQATLFPKTAGERLKEAREAQGLSLAEIAARTRIPVRQLEAIEVSNFAAMPSITYSVGFAKAYARAVGADEVAIAHEIRGQNDVATRHVEYESFEQTDSSRAPTSGIVIACLIGAVLLLIGVGLWYGTSWFRGDGSALAAAPNEAAQLPQAAPVAAPAPAAADHVTITATDEVWMRIYDATGKTLYENTLKAGDRYDVPDDANNPMINVGRPDKLQVMVNGAAIPPLGNGARAIQDVPISAAALAARASAAPKPTPSATPTRAASTPRATRRPAVSRPQSESTPAAITTPPVVTPTPTVPAATATLAP
ncbi:MAG: helix-turn-helix domain-containing protein [Sphingomonas sp.]